LNILKHQIDDSLLAEGFLELDQVVVLHHFQNFDLSHSSFFNDFIVLCFFELLNCQDLLGVVALALEDDSVGTLSYDSQYIVFLH
jgi:hypothetical protein